MCWQSWGEFKIHVELRLEFLLSFFFLHHFFFSRIQRVWILPLISQTSKSQEQNPKQKLNESETQIQKKKKKYPSDKEDKEARDPGVDEPPRCFEGYATKAHWVRLEVPISIQVAITTMIRCIAAWVSL